MTLKLFDRYDGRGGPRVAIAHDYLTQRGGAEKVVLAMSRAFPKAPIYTLLFDPATTYPEFGDCDVRVSGLNRIGPLRRHHRAALPILPFAATSMMIDADVVLISTSGWAHGVRTRGRKLVYCHSLTGAMALSAGSVPGRRRWTDETRWPTPDVVLPQVVGPPCGAHR